MKNSKKKDLDVDVERRFLLSTKDFEIRVDQVDKKPRIIGYAAVFDKLSEKLGYGFREKIAPGAFTNTLKAKDDVRALVDHDPSQLLGRTKSKTLALEENDIGLKMTIDLPSTTLARDITELINRKDLSGASFGFRTISDEWYMDDGEEIRVLKEVKLFDVSIVTYPAYPDTKVAVRRLEIWKKEQEPKAENRGRMRMRLALAEVE